MSIIYIAVPKLKDFARYRYFANASLRSRGGTSRRRRRRLERTFLPQKDKVLQFSLFLPLSKNYSAYFGVFCIGKSPGAVIWRDAGGRWEVGGMQRG